MMEPVNDREIGYLAGFFDGEGCASTNRKRCWQLYLSGKPAKRLFEMIEPFVIVKRQQIALIMHWFTLQGKYIPHERAVIWEQMRGFNSGRAVNKTAYSAASVTSDTAHTEVET